MTTDEDEDEDEIGISDELRRIYASAPSDRHYVETLELAHPLFPQTYYVANDVRAWAFKLTAAAPTSTTFQPVRFAVTLPAMDARGQQDLQMAIDNVGREAMDAIEAAAADPTKHIAVTYRVYLDLADSVPQIDPPLVLALQSIIVTNDAITGTATRADVLNRPFPSELYRADTYPGLDR